MALLEIKNLKLGYDSNVIIKDLSFSVHEGDYLCVVGENGSGKTTLMKTLLHLQDPLDGQILSGEEMKSTEIGYLPQQSDAQRDFPASVKEIVLSGCQGMRGLRPYYRKEEKKLAKDNMERMGILELADHSYRELSGGQQQRVLLARALCAAKRILLLDEPVTGLDPKVSAEMYDLIRELNENGMTIIMISHDIEMAVRYASHILHIGSNVFYGTTKKYLESELGSYFMKEEGTDVR